MLDPDVIFLNHGSFGACPRPVFAVYQSYQAELERHPARFLRLAGERLAESRAALGRYVNAAADDLVYLQNPTTALNVVIRSLRLGAGDQILGTDHEYGALDRAWRFAAQKTGARYIRQPILLPLTDEAAFIDAFWAGVGERTRVVYLSHVTSPTALTFPIAEICRRARAAGIVSVIDGAHAPSNIPLDLAAIDADFYAGSCHKWLCAPKGTAFLYAHHDRQHLLDPLIVSWGWESDHPGPSRFIDHHQIQGTRDPSAFLSVPAAIAFQQEHGWDSVRQRCHTLAQATRRRIDDLTGLDPICPDGSDWYSQMVSIRLPEGTDTTALGKRLFDDHHIEIPVLRWNNQPFLRLSVQAYVSEADLDALVEALTTYLSEH